MNWLVIAAFWACAAPPNAPIKPAKTVDFIGFSKNDEVSAWRIAIKRTQAAGVVDHFSLVKIVDVKSARLLATLRESSISRTDAKGHPLSVSPSVLAASNPDWRDAGAKSVWDKLHHVNRFSALKHEFKDSLVRLVPDGDSNISVTGDNKAAFVQGKIGEPLGYGVIARLFEGGTLPLGHYRSTTPLTHGEVEVFFSPDAVCVAVINRFYTQDRPDAPETQALLVASTPQDPVGTTKTGVQSMSEEDARSGIAIFKRMHPKEANDFDRYIGQYF